MASTVSYSLGAKVLRFLFGFNMGIAMLISAGFIKIVSFLPLSKGTKEAAALRFIQFFWRAVLFLSSPWIPITAASGVEEEIATFNKCLANFEATKGRPVFCLGNHTSFLDTILTVSMLPTHAIGRSRTYMGAHLYKLPILSGICKGCGHFPVYFTSSQEGKFSVDKEKMAAVAETVDEHIKENGLLCFYPEGQMNSTPKTILPLRYGGINKALEFDAALFTFVTCGNEIVWPKKVQLGGFPANVGYSIKAVAPDGVKALLASVRKNNQEGLCGCDKDSPDHILLAKWVQNAMQEQYDHIDSRSGNVDRSKSE